MNIELSSSNCLQIANAFDLYYEYNVTWGSLHVMLDEGSYDRSTAEWCKKYAIEHQDWLGAFLCSILLQLTDEQLKHLEDTPSMTDFLLTIILEKK